MSTIFAESTARGKAGIAVIRISGSGAGKALLKLGIKKIPQPRRAVVAKIYGGSELIDSALILWMPAPHSFTGEDVAEIHLHGSRATVNILSKTLLDMGLTPAEPGEFTRRALMNGKMDLTEAEGLADLIDAETRAQAKQAVRQMQGELGNLYESWREKIIQALAHIEAYIDFPDEDLPPALIQDFIKKIKELSGSISAHLDDNKRGEIIRRGFHVAIVGAPNVGKSTLLNWLARRDIAIVSAIPGTTRDVIEVNLDLAGFPVTIADTAGIRESKDAIEIEGVRRARLRAEESDMKIVMLDAAEAPDFNKESLGLIDENSLVVVNKCDLSPRRKPGSGKPQIPASAGMTPIEISLKNQTGLDELLSAITKILEQRLAPSDAPQITRERHRALLSEALTHLQNLENPAIFKTTELAAENLRAAATAIGKITGRIDLEEVLDELFKSFCIGK